MDSGFDVLEKLISATNTRHKVLTSNVANVDTPGYRAKDVDFRKFLLDAYEEMKTTDPKHIQPSPAGVTSSLVPRDNHAWGDRNDVELDVEIAKMTENALLNQAGIRLMSAKMRMIRNASRRT